MKNYAKIGVCDTLFRNKKEIAKLNRAILVGRFVNALRLGPWKKSESKIKAEAKRAISKK